MKNPQNRNTILPTRNEYLTAFVDFALNARLIYGGTNASPRDAPKNNPIKTRGFVLDNSSFAVSYPVEITSKLKLEISFILKNIIPNINAKTIN